MQLGPLAELNQLLRLAKAVPYRIRLFNAYRRFNSASKSYAMTPAFFTAALDLSPSPEVPAALSASEAGLKS